MKEKEGRRDIIIKKGDVMEFEINLYNVVNLFKYFFFLFVFALPNINDKTTEASGL